MLRIIRAKKSGKRFVGCEGWDGENPDSPDSCDVTMPLPQRVRGLYKIEEVCSVCEWTPRLMVVPFRGRPWKLCLNDDCPSMAEMKARRAEREAAKAAKEAAEAAEKDGEGVDPKEAAKEAEKIAGQASATKTKRARSSTKNGSKKNGARRRRPAPRRSASTSRERGSSGFRTCRPPGVRLFGCLTQCQPLVCGDGVFRNASSTEWASVQLAGLPAVAEEVTEWGMPLPKIGGHLTVCCAGFGVGVVAEGGITGAGGAVVVVGVGVAVVGVVVGLTVVGATVVRVTVVGGQARRRRTLCCRPHR